MGKKILLYSFILKYALHLQSSSIFSSSPTDSLVSPLGQLLTLLLIWPLTLLTQTAGTATTPLPHSLRGPPSPSYWPQVRLHGSQVAVDSWFTFWIHPLVSTVGNQALDQWLEGNGVAYWKPTGLPQLKMGGMWSILVPSCMTIGRASVFGSSSLQTDRWTDMLQVSGLCFTAPSCCLLHFFFFCSVLILEYRALKIDSVLYCFVRTGFISF